MVPGLITFQGWSLRTGRIASALPRNDSATLLRQRQVLPQQHEHRFSDWRASQTHASKKID